MGFVTGFGLAPSVRGTTSRALLHVSDWLPSIVTGMLGLKVHSPEHAPALDGINSWKAIAEGGPSNRTEILINLCPEFSVLAGGQVRYGWQQSALLLDFAQQQHNAQPLGQITGVMKLIWGLPGDEDMPTCKAPGCKNGWQRPPMLHNASWPAPEPPEIASFSPGIWLFNLTEV